MRERGADADSPGTGGQKHREPWMVSIKLTVDKTWDFRGDFSIFYLPSGYD
jgi:hypothetical protein